MARRNLLYYIQEGFSSLLRHGAMTFAATGIAAACLLVVGSVTLVAVNAAAALREQLEESSEIVAFVDETYSRAQSRALEKTLLAVPNVAGAQYISREEAMDSFKGQMPDEELFQDLNPDILNDRYALKLTDLELLSDTVEQVSQVRGVSWVRVDQDVTDGFLTLRNVSAVVSLCLIAVLLLVSVFIISNTIRLTTYDRREEIAIMRIVGAANGFIRGPFVFEGLYMGLCAAVTAFLLQWLLYDLVALAAGGGDGVHLLRILPFETLWLPVAGAFLTAGVVTGVAGSAAAIRKYLEV